MNIKCVSLMLVSTAITTDMQAHRSRSVERQTTSSYRNPQQAAINDDDNANSIEFFQNYMIGLFVAQDSETKQTILNDILSEFLINRQKCITIVGIQNYYLRQFDRKLIDIKLTREGLLVIKQDLDKNPNLQDRINQAKKIMNSVLKPGKPKQGEHDQQNNVDKGIELPQKNKTDEQEWQSIEELFTAIDSELNKQEQQTLLKIRRRQNQARLDVLPFANRMILCNKKIRKAIEEQTERHRPGK